MTKKEQAKQDLIKALEQAKGKALEHIENDDGGTCNFDTALLLRPLCLTKAEFEEAVKAAGLRCRYDNSRYSAGKGYYHINGYESGQGNRRTDMVEAFSESLNKSGYMSAVYYQMD